MPPTRYPVAASDVDGGTPVKWKCGVAGTNRGPRRRVERQGTLEGADALHLAPQLGQRHSEVVPDVRIGTVDHDCRLLLDGCLNEPAVRLVFDGGKQVRMA